MVNKFIYMKKALISLSLLAASFAQAQTGAWYNYGEVLKYDIGFNTGYYRTHIFPDSTVNVDYSSGLGSVWMHSLGQVMDPYSDIFDNSIAGAVDPSIGYTVDSINFPYRYFRHQTGAPDTLIIQFFKQTNFDNLYEDPWAGDPTYGGRSYARLSYDSTLRRGDNPFLEIVEILDFNDTSSIWQTKKYAIGETIGVGEVVGATVTYIPGNAYNTGDTLDTYFNNPTPTNQINDFIMYYFLDDIFFHTTGFYNHGIIASHAARYEDNSNFWDKQYWPGIASSYGIYHADIGFKISSAAGTAIEESSSIHSLAIIPNPASSNALLSFKLTKPTNDGELIIYDISGKKINNMKLQNLIYGKNNIQLPVKDLKNGLYLVTINLEGEVYTKQLVVSR